MEEKKRFLLNFTFCAVVVLIVYVLFKYLFKSLFPVLLSFVIAVSVQKMAVVIAKKVKIPKRIVASVLGVTVYILAASVIGVLFYFALKTGKNLFGEFAGIAQEIKTVILDFKESFTGVFKNISPEFSAKAEEMLVKTTEEILRKAGDTATNVLANVAKNAPTILFNTAISIVACSYIAKDYDKLLKFFKNLFGAKIFENAVRIKLILVNSVFKILKGYLKLAFITFIVLVAVFWFINVKWFVFIALIVSFVDLLPVLGTGTVLVPWGIIDVISGDIKRGIIILLTFLAITLLKNFLEPKIIARQVGINPLFMLISIFIGFKFFGFFGMFLVPITLVVLYEFYSGEMYQTD